MKHFNPSPSSRVIVLPHGVDTRFDAILVVAPSFPSHDGEEATMPFLRDAPAGFEDHRTRRALGKARTLRRDQARLDKRSRRFA